MKPATADAAPTRTPLRGAAEDGWRERAGRLLGEFERPAKSMVRRAFRGAFCSDELDDIYASAWVGTLRALAGREAELADDEIRSYVLTAVANQAGKELRRRRRKPTAPLELVGALPDQGDTPEEINPPRFPAPS
jgi:DNA-directed RNA polymerase specialized sigma24 family protein